MDFGELLEYLAPLAFLLIALFNSFLRKEYNFLFKNYFILFNSNQFFFQRKGFQ